MQYNTYMDYKKERKRIIASSKLALSQLDKLIRQNIDLDELDPEKAKAAAQGKIEAIQGSLQILKVIQEIEEMDREVEETKKKKDFFGVESRIK